MVEPGHIDGRTIQGFDSFLRSKILQEYGGYEYELVIYPSYTAVLNATRFRQCDIGWAPFTMTVDRENCSANTPPTQSNTCIDFAAPILSESLGMLYRRERFSQETSTIAYNFFTPQTVNAMCILAIMIAISAHLIWFLESRGGNKHFSREYWAGIDESYWWAIVTATTVGYGDYVPVTPLGRMVASVHLLGGVVFFAYLSGEITAQLVHPSASDHSWSSFRSSKICTTPYYLETLVSPNGIPEVEVVTSPDDQNDMDQCFAALKAGTVDCVFYDEKIMGAFAVSDPEIRFTDFAFAPLQSIQLAYAFPDVSEHPGADFAITAPEFNVLLRQYLMTDEITRAAKENRYFGSFNHEPSEKRVLINWGLVITVCVCVAPTILVQCWRMRKWIMHYFAELCHLLADNHVGRKTGVHKAASSRSKTMHAGKGWHTVKKRIKHYDDLSSNKQFQRMEATINVMAKLLAAREGLKPEELEALTQQEQPDELGSGKVAVPAGSSQRERQLGRGSEDLPTVQALVEEGPGEEAAQGRGRGARATTPTPRPVAAI